MTIECHPTLGDGLAALIGSQPDMALVGTATNLAEARSRFAEIKPDLALVDVDMPQHAGLQIIREILAEDPNTRIIALITYEWDELASAALKAGAQALLPKDRISERLLPMIRER